MKARTLHTRFWNDSYIIELNSIEKLLFMYLITNEYVTMSGIYELPDKIICNTLSFDKDEYLPVKNKFEADRKFSFFKGWIYVANNARYHLYTPAPNIVNAFKKEWAAVPVTIRDYFFNKQKYSFQMPFYNSDKVKINLHEINTELEVVIDRVIDSTGRPTGTRTGTREPYDNELENGQKLQKMDEYVDPNSISI